MLRIHDFSKNKKNKYIKIKSIQEKSRKRTDRPSLQNSQTFQLMVTKFLWENLGMRNIGKVSGIYENYSSYEYCIPGKSKMEQNLPDNVFQMYLAILSFLFVFTRCWKSPVAGYSSQAENLR